MNKHRYYQQIQAYANGYKIESADSLNIWKQVTNPRFYDDEYHQYRIVPDKDGWIPFYVHEESECPVDPGQIVEALISHSGETCRIPTPTSPAGYLDWSNVTESTVTRYRLVEEVDSYKDLKAAYKRGETIQVYHITHGWVDITEGTAWLLPADQYRIKPDEEKEPKTRKVKLLAYVDSATGGLTYRFEHRKLKGNWKRAPQLDKHGIEVEE